MAGILAAVAAIVSICVSLASAGVTTHQVTLSSLNQETRNTIQNLTSKINAEIASGRLKSSKLLTLLNGKNQHALMTYLYNNPVISKNVEDLNKDAAQLQKYQAELQAIETEVQTYTNQLQSLGYSQSHGGVTKEKKKASEIQGQLNDAQSRYNSKVKEMEGMNLDSSTVSTKPYVSDIDAATQNVKGGLI